MIDRHDILRNRARVGGLTGARASGLEACATFVAPCFPALDGAGELWERFDPRRHRLDVRRAPLFEAIEAYDAPRNRWLLLLLFHHLAVDHTTLEVIFTEVRAHLKAGTNSCPRRCHSEASSHRRCAPCR